MYIFALSLLRISSTKRMFQMARWLQQMLCSVLAMDLKHCLPPSSGWRLEFSPKGISQRLASAMPSVGCMITCKCLPGQFQSWTLSPKLTKLVVSIYLLQHTCYRCIQCKLLPSCQQLVLWYPPNFWWLLASERFRQAHQQFLVSNSSLVSVHPRPNCSSCLFIWI